MKKELIKAVAPVLISGVLKYMITKAVYNYILTQVNDVSASIEGE